MQPHFVHTGLQSYLNAVPLPIPLPPGPPESWSCLYATLGHVAFLKDNYSEAAPKNLLREILGYAGRPTRKSESRLLLLTTPIPGGLDVIELIARCLHGRDGDDAARLLGMLGDTAAIPYLERHIDSDNRGTKEQVIRALGRLGGGAKALARWDDDNDEQRLLALVRQGVLPEELPSGELEMFAAWFTDLSASAGQEVVESVASSSDTIAEIVAEVLIHNPGATAGLAEPLCELVGKCCDSALWSRALAAAGEELGELLLERMTDGDWRIRMGATIVLGLLEDVGDLGLPELRRALTDDDSDVRREAGLALVQRTGSGRVDTWTDSWDFLARCTAHPWGSALRGGPVPIDLFAMLARRDSSGILAQAILALAFAHPELAAPVAESLARDDGMDAPMEVREASAAALLATGKAPGSAPLLHRVLLMTEGGPLDGLSAEELSGLAARDSDWQVRLNALKLLERTGRGGDFDGLLARIAAVDSDSDVREQAQSMRRARFTAVSAGDALAAVIVSSRVDEEARVRGLDSLYRDLPSLAVEIAGSLFNLSNRGLAMSAARILGESTTAENCRERIRRATDQLRASDWIAREAAAAMLGHLRPEIVDEDVLEELLETLEVVATDDSDSDVQNKARWAAGALKGKA